MLNDKLKFTITAPDGTDITLTDVAGLPGWDDILCTEEHRSVFGRLQDGIIEHRAKTFQQRRHEVTLDCIRQWTKEN